MNISLALRRVRFEKGLKQVDVSRKTKISQTYLSQLEGGTKEPRKATLDKLCKFYGVPYIVLAWLGMEDKDVKNDKKYLFEQLKPVMDAIISNLIKAK